MAQQILCISFLGYQADSRVLRQLKLLAEAGEVTTLSYGERPPGATHHLEIDASLPSLPQTPLGVPLLALRQHSAVELSAPAVRQRPRARCRAPLRPGGGERGPGAAAGPRRRPRRPGLGRMHEWAPEERSHVLPWKLLVEPYMYASAPSTCRAPPR